MQANIPVDKVMAHVIRTSFEDLGESLKDALDVEKGITARQKELLDNFANTLIEAGQEGGLNPWATEANEPAVDMEELIRQWRGGQPAGEGDAGLVNHIDDSSIFGKGAEGFDMDEVRQQLVDDDEPEVIDPTVEKPCETDPPKGE